METNLVVMENNLAVTTSLIIAEVFEKKHYDVLEKIVKLKAEVNSTENSVQLFEETNYRDLSGKVNKMYYMNRDGFTLLAMGFTGSKALQWKLKYIEAFNRMEKTLKENSVLTNNKENELLLKMTEQSMLMMEHTTKFMERITERLEKLEKEKEKVVLKEESEPMTRKEIFKSLVMKVKKTSLMPGTKWTVVYDRIAREKGIDVREKGGENILNWMENEGLLDYAIKTAKIIIAEQERI